MRSRTLNALADLAKTNGQAAAEILRDFAEYERKLAQLSEAHLEAENWKRIANERSAAITAEKNKRQDAVYALGDGWHALRCGGGILIENGQPIRIRDGGEHTEERRSAVVREARDLGFDCLWCEDYEFDTEQVRWTSDGETAVKNDTPTPF